MNLELPKANDLHLDDDPVEVNFPSNRSQRLSNFFAAWKKNGPAALISRNPFKNKVLLDYMVSHGMEATPVEAMIFDRCYGKFVAMDWGLLVLCIDDFDGLGPVFNKIRYFRDERPHIPVVLTSFAFKSNDHTQERLAICDLSLKFPLDLASLDEAFEAIWHNNHNWVQRALSMQDTPEAD